MSVVAALVVSCSGGSGKGTPTTSSSTTTSTPADVHYPPRVALFGDSLSWEAQSY
jgi:hypothetical protein